MTRALLLTADILAGVAAVMIGVALPPARLSSAATPRDGAIAGVIHVHTNRSDGLSSPDDIAAMAARAGLQFVVFTDHGDGTRRPDRPQYRSGVLCVDAVEISTSGGHVVALGLPETPYPFAGDPREVLEDVHRLGGFAIAAHPDSPKSDLMWRDWDLPIDGVELVNLDTAWRKHLPQGGWRPTVHLLASLGTYLVRPAETIASLLGDDQVLLSAWHGIAHRRRASIFAGVDAHARLELRDSAPGDNRLSLSLPGYEAVFRTLTMHVRPERPLVGDAEADARLVLDALERGASFAVVDAIFGPPAFEFSATVGGTTVEPGDRAKTTGPASLTVQTNAPPTFTTTIWRNGEVLASQSTQPNVTLDGVAGPAVYQVAIRATDRPAAPIWLMSNPIYVGGAPAETPSSNNRSEQSGAVSRSGAAPAADTRRPRVLLDAVTQAVWRTEVASASKAAVDLVTEASLRELRVRYGLPGGDAFGQFAAAVVETPGGVAPHDRLVFTARAERPMRLSIQVRALVGLDQTRRWQRTIYVDDAVSTHTLLFDSFTPVEEGIASRPPAGNVLAILFIVDRTHTKPGASGRFWLRDVSLR